MPAVSRASMPSAADTIVARAAPDAVMTTGLAASPPSRARSLSGPAKLAPDASSTRSPGFSGVRPSRASVAHAVAGVVPRAASDPAGSR